MDPEVGFGGGGVSGAPSERPKPLIGSTGPGPIGVPATPWLVPGAVGSWYVVGPLSPLLFPAVIGNGGRQVTGRDRPDRLALLKMDIQSLFSDCSVSSPWAAA